MLEEALNNPNYPPAEAARALLSYLSNELPTGPEAEYRFCQVLYPLTVSRVFGPLGPFDAQFRHGAGGWLSRSARWGVGGAGGGGGSSASSRTSHGRNVVSSASARLHQLHVPGGVGIGSSIGSAAALSSDPVVQLLSVSPPPSSRTSGSSHGGMLGGRGSQRGSGSAGGRGQQQRQPPSTLIDVISEETEHRPAIHLSFPFLALPELDWRLLLQLVELNCGANGPITEGTDNGRRLYGSLLRVTPLEQRGVVRLYQEITFQLEKDRQEQQQRQQQAVAMGSPPSYSSPQSMPMWQQQQQQQQQQGFSPQPMQQSPAGQQTQQQQQQQEQQNPVQKAMSETVLLLTMWEFYFFLFARYPFFKPSSSSSSTSSNGNTRAQSTNQSHQRGAVAAPYTNPSTHARSPSSSNVRRGGGSSYGDAVYSHLFAVYVRHYLPHRRTSANPTGAMPLTAPAPLSECSEVFLGITIDYWLEGENVLLLQRQQRHRRAEEQLRRQRHHQNGGGVGVGVGLAGAYDDAQLPDDGGKSYYHPTPPLVARGLRYLVGHVASDPAVQSAVLRWNGTVGGGGVDRNGSAAGETVDDSRAAAADPSDSPPCWCLTPASTALQQPILNYVRLAFRYAPFHSNDSPFYTALDMWLTWLEPWNLAPRRATFASGNLSKDRILNQITASMGSHTTSAAPKPTAPSKYTALWEPYIAANVHLYTTPLAVFLRRAKDFDFSPRDFRRSLTTVQKVFRVFSPQVVQAINDVLGETSPAPLSSLRVQHEQNLGEFCPPDPISLSTTGPDVHNLLEEMYFQHDKKLREFDFLDRMDDRMQNMSGHGTKGERASIDRVREGGRVIAGFPADYDASSGGWEGRQRGAERLAGAAGAATAAPERVTNGIFLTENGREQVLTGRRLFHPEDVKFLGDPMNARVKSYEIGFLVHWCNFVSCWLNERLGLVPTDEANAGRSKDGGEDATPVMLRLVREGEESKKVWFRINLRFLADYRNLVFFAVVATMVKLFRSMF